MLNKLKSQLQSKLFTYIFSLKNKTMERCRKKRRKRKKVKPKEKTARRKNKK